MQNSFSKPGRDQVAGCKDMAGWLAVQDAAEHRLVEAELLLDGRRGQADLPADLPLALPRSAAPSSRAGRRTPDPG